MLLFHGTKNGSSFVFADLERDFFPAKHWAVTPSFGIGSFSDGEDVAADALYSRVGKILKDDLQIAGSAARLLG